MVYYEIVAWIFGASLSDVPEENTIKLSDKAYATLLKAKKVGESFSDVVIRLASTKLTGLQKRGEKEIVTSDDRRLAVAINQDLCVGAESCVTLAPEVFALDESQLGGPRWDTEPLGMREVEERTVDSERIVRAARSCPYQAITVRDAETGEQVVP